MTGSWVSDEVSEEDKNIGTHLGGSTLISGCQKIGYNPAPYPAAATASVGLAKT